jgi:hypothetical protein
MRRRLAIGVAVMSMAMASACSNDSDAASDARTEPSVASSTNTHSAAGSGPDVASPTAATAEQPAVTQAIPTSTSGAPATQPALQQGAELTAIRTALEFFDARNAWDGPAARALVADDADVADFAVDAPDHYLAMAVLERTLQWQYLDPVCTATMDGAVGHVRCTYLMQNGLSEAVGTGPYSGSRMDFEISDGLIQMVANTFDHSLYSTEVLVPYVEWLDVNHPGDSDVMFITNEQGDTNRSLSPESLALWAEHLPEYVAFQVTE